MEARDPKVASRRFEARQRRNREWAETFLGKKVEERAHLDQMAPEGLWFEVARVRESRRLGLALERLCNKHGLRGAPKDSLTRWLFTRKLQEPPEQPQGPPDTLFDPLFPSCGERDGGLEDELLKLGLSEEDAIELVGCLAEESRKSVATVHACGVDEGADPPSLYAKDGRHGRFFEVSYGGLAFPISTSSFERLQKRHRGEEKDLPRDVWRMMARYHALTGEGYQGGVRQEVLKHLQSAFGVDHECFASPLNVFLSSFCSAFPDTDSPFGSKGSFFDLRARLACDADWSGGSFEVNPPFLEEIMLAAALYLEAWLQDDFPLLFFVFYPGWKDTPGVEVLQKSKFLSHSLFLRKKDHTYLPGYQHLPSRQKSLYSYADSFVFVLQNGAGKEKWRLTEADMKSIAKLMRGTK